jgi:hypothetical protein
MKLFIACILIYGFGLHWVMYPIAIVVAIISILYNQDMNN